MEKKVIFYFFFWFWEKGMRPRRKSGEGGGGGGGGAVGLPRNREHKGKTLVEITNKKSSFEAKV